MPLLDHFNAPWDETVSPLPEQRTRADLAAQRNAVTLHRHGVTQYRSGRYKEALALFQESLSVHGKGGHVDTSLFLAMTLAQLDRADEARKQLGRFEQWHRQQHFTNWQERVLWDVLLREARLVVNSPRMPKATDSD
jgi:hypothetical protein